MVMVPTKKRSFAPCSHKAVLAKNIDAHGKTYTETELHVALYFQTLKICILKY
jgi:hypothetical protein